MKVLVETSARHVHVTEEHLEVLFGKGAVLTPKKSLSQPGQFACVEEVDVVGPKSALKGVSILGPTRRATQVELSATDARSIGIQAPLRDSGNIAGSAPCRLIGPAGEVELSEGVIVARRHLHATPDDAARMNLQHGQIISIKIDGTGRSMTFGDVVVRVSPKSALAVHVDTDEANAGSLSGEVWGEVIA